MFSTTTYNIVDTIRFLAGEEKWKDYYTFYFGNESNFVKDVNDLYREFSDKFKTSNQVSATIVEALIGLKELNDKFPNEEPYGKPKDTVILTATNGDDFVGKVVVFTKDILNGDYHFEPKMKARIQSIRVIDEGTEHEHYCVKFAIAEFEEHNTKLMQANYYDKNRIPCLTWKESPFWPTDGVESSYFSNPMPFLVER